MDPGALGGLAKALRPIANAALRIATRLYAERKAGADPSTGGTGLLDESLNQTLTRLTDGHLEDAWWRQLLRAAAQSYVSPDGLRASGVQEWLSATDVRQGLRTIARAKIMATPSADSETTREQLAGHYTAATGETSEQGSEAIEVIVGILAAGYIATIPPEQRALAGMVQEVHREVSRQGERNPPALVADHSAIERFHTKEARLALERVLLLRTFDAAQAAADAQELWRRLSDGGDLVATADAEKRRVRYWTTRLCSISPDTLESAKELRQELQPGDAKEELAVIDAWIAAGQGDSNAAIRELRRLDDPDARANLIALLAQDQGDAVAIERFADVDPEADPDTFTDAGWRVWALCLARLTRWEDAAAGLQALAKSIGASPALATAELPVNAALLIPEERRLLTLSGPPLYVGIQPSIHPAAFDHHARASASCEFLEHRLSEVATGDLAKFLAHWHLWVRLMDPDLESREAAREETRTKMRVGAHAIELMPFTWAFGIEFDTAPLRTYLEQNQRFGGLDNQEFVAEFLLNHKTMNAIGFAAYVEANLVRLDQTLDKAQTRSMLFEALLQEDQTERARRVLSEMPTDVDAAVRQRMRAAIDAQDGHQLRARLEAAFAETDDLLDLHNLIAHLQSVGDHAAASPLTRTLFDREPTPKNGIQVVMSMLRADAPDYDSILAFTEQQPQLAQQSDDVVSAKAWALLYTGRLAEAKALNDALSQKREREEDLALDVDVAVALGEWERLPAIVNRAWIARDKLGPRILMTLARHAGNPSRALGLARLAVDKAPNNPFVLASAYGLHFELGKDDQADPDWLGRALESSSPADGPIWQTNLDQMVNEMLPRHREQQNNIERMLANCEVPIVLAFGMSNVPLSRVLLETPQRALESRDGRRRNPLPIVHGGRADVQLHADWRIAFDLTSLMVLHYLGLLDAVLRTCRQVSIPAETMESLYLERFEVRFHQPARVKAARQLRHLADIGSIKTIDRTLGRSSLADEVGIELATLLSTCREDGGFVICGKPIHKPNSLMEELADTSPYDDIIVTAADLCVAINRGGFTDGSTHKHAMEFLASQGQGQSASIPSSLLDGPIFVDRLAWSHLQNAHLLEALADLSLDTRIHRNLLEEATVLIEAGDTGDALAERIDGVRMVLRAGIEAGVVSFLPFASGPTEENLGRRPTVRAMEGWLAGAAACDALCADDRYLNSRSQAIATTGESAPVLCVLDLLQYLLDRGAVTQAQYWRAKQRLRQAGFVFVPLEAGELGHWLEDPPVDEQGLAERAELKVVRQYVNWIDSLDLLTEAETTKFVTEHMKSCVQYITAVWTDPAVPPEQATVLGDWVWQNLVATTFVDKGAHADATAASNRADMLTARLTVAFLPRVAGPEERRAAYKSWLERSVVGAFGATNNGLVAEALRRASTIIRDAYEPWQPFGNIFLDCLPRRIQNIAVDADPGFANEAGFVSGSLVNVGANVPVDDLFDAARSAFATDERIQIDDVSGREVAVTPGRGGEGEVVLLLQYVDENDRAHNAAVQELALLSPDSEVRRGTAARILARLGPTTLIPATYSEDMERRQPTRDEFLLIVQEIGGGITPFRRALAGKMKTNTGLGLKDFVPQSGRYWDRLCGPATDGKGIEAYIRDGVVPYRKALLRRDLAGGLDVCCLGALRDDLLPGAWLGEYSDDALWDVLDSLDIRGNAIAQLAALDIALYRLTDERFEQFAIGTVRTLLDSKLALSAGHDVYRLFQVICDLVMNSLSAVDGMASEPAFRRRMCAWMQSAVVSQIMVTSGPPVDMDALEEWSRSQLSFAGEARRLVDSRTEPMVLAGQLGASSLRYEVAMRLVRLKARHEAAGRVMPLGNEVLDALDSLTSTSARPQVPVPGPCELHLVPEAPMTDETLDFLATLWGQERSPQALELLAGASQIFAIDQADRRRCIEVVSELGHDGTLALSDAVSWLYPASIVAASTRDTSLAEAIAEAITRLASTLRQPRDVEWVTRILLQAAVSHREELDWALWLSDKLSAAARIFPATPVEGLRTFLDGLNAMEPALPVSLWFHLEAKCVALAGTR